MKRIVDYSTFTCTRMEATDAALEDCKRYLGDAFPVTVKAIRQFLDDNAECSKGSCYRVMRNSLSLFSGIEGRYPVRAMYRAAMQYEEPAKASHPHLTLVLSGTTRTIPVDRSHPDLEWPDGHPDTDN